MSESGNFVVLRATHEAKLKELLHKINSVEIKLYSDGVKEFIKLLKGNSGGDLLRYYVNSTCNFSELFAALKLREGKSGTHYMFKLISVVLSHPDGIFKADDKGRIGVSAVLDKFARFFIEEKLDFVYKELVSKDKKRQNAALLVLASVVRRGSSLASEVAKKFDFELKGFSKLSEYELRNNKRRKNSIKDENRKYITRKAFVGLATSFLEVGKPGLLRWVLQQREVYSGVLRVLSTDDDETVMYVLSVLRDKVLIEESLVPPALRSVLFGSVVLEQLADISLAWKHSEPTAELAHNVLHMVCTDPSNGLMPDSKTRPNNPLKGNPKRLLQLMKKLKATEVEHHSELLLAIVRGRPSLGSAYLEVFPYGLEDYASPSWFSSVSLAAKLVSSVTLGASFGIGDSQFDDPPPSFDSEVVQNIMKILSSRTFSRSILNKGLLHPDFLVKTGTLRLLLEILRLIDSFMRALTLNSDKKQTMPKWVALKQEIRSEIQTLLPDPQVFLTLLSSLSGHARTDNSCLKRAADKGNFLFHCKRTKKLKRSIEDTDIIIGGISSAHDDAFHKDGENILDLQIPHASEKGMDLMNVLLELWGFDQCCMSLTTLKDAEILFQAKLLDVVKIYLMIMPTALDGSFDFFMNLFGNPSELPSTLLSSLLSLLVEYIRWSPGSGIAIRTPPMMYKHLQPLLSLLLFSPILDMNDQAFKLAQAAMSSTGAFDRNVDEIVAWFLFLPGYSTVKSSVEIHEEVPRNLLIVVISFLCDAISTVGNNLYGCWRAVRNCTSRLIEYNDISPEFSPLILCVLQKCIRLLGAKSGAFSLSEKSIISTYICNTLKYLLQIQVDARLLAALIQSVLSEGLQDCGSMDLLCEWRPLKNLLLLAESILHQTTCCLSFIDNKDLPVDIPFMKSFGEIRNIIENGDGSGEITELMNAFYSAIICTTSDVVLKNFPTVMTISQQIHVPLSCLSSIIFLDQNFLAGVLKLWPKVFFPGLEKAISMHSLQVRANNTFSRDIMINADLNASEAPAAVAFGLFLWQAPFHVLFPMIISSDGSCLPESSIIKDLLKAKLSECRSDFLASYLRLLLFWFYQIQLSYRVKPSAKLEEFAEICYVLVRHLLDQIFVIRPESGDPLSAELLQEVVKAIACHPAVKASLTCPLGCNDSCINEDFTGGNFSGNLEAFCMFSKHRVHPIDHHILDILTATFNYLSLSNWHHYVVKDGADKQIVNAFKTLIQRLLLELKEKLDLFIRTEYFIPLLQSFYALHTLVQLASPFKLFKLAHWIFDRVEMNGLTVLNSTTRSALLIGFCITADAFKLLSDYLRQPVRDKALLYRLWKMEGKEFCANCIGEIYLRLCKFASDYRLEFAYSCLLEAFNTVYEQKYVKPESFDPLSLVISRVILSTPTEIVSHCIYGTDRTKAKLLLLLVETSPMHLSVLGYLFSKILNENVHFVGKIEEDTSRLPLSDEDFLLLLPAALSFLKSIFMRLERQYHKQFRHITSFYSKILLCGFRNWKSFVSGYVFQENYDEFLPSSIEDLINLVDASLLGKAMHMLRYSFALIGEMKIEKRLKMFSYIVASSDAHDQLLDCNIDEIELYSSAQLLNLINRVAAKIEFCKMLFSFSKQISSVPKDADESKAMDMVSSKEGNARMQFIQILVRTWQCLVKKFPSVSDCSIKEKTSGCLQLYRHLELLILKTVLELVTEMCDYLLQLQAIPFLHELMRSSLLYRFEDSNTLNVLRSILSLLLSGKFSSILYLQMLLSHSQFASAIQSVAELHSSQTGALFRPMRSILRSLDLHHSNSKNDLQSTNPHLKQLEILKLLRTLIEKLDQIGNYSGQEMDINLKELYLLLLSSYGATLSEIDLEIFGLIRAIESIDNSVSEALTETNYLWGNAVLRVRKERVSDLDMYSSCTTDREVFEQRRSQFREILSINPKTCLTTVIYFPYDRLETDDPKEMQVQLAHFPGVEKLHRYDPIFILNFSSHILSVGYIEPLEFACSGLLAVAYISMSSPNMGIRKLGNACLAKFKDTLERCEKKKDLMRLHLLLAYIQNGIKEQLQRIPSVIALFAAESSFILLDPSNDLFTTLSNHLMRSSMVDMKSIPLFHTLFQSNSVNFRAERLWMLRLICAGLSLDDDAQIFISNSILETLLSFYATPLADNDSKELILQIVKKSVKLGRMTRHLVDFCGLFPWLSSIISGTALDASENSFSTLQLVLAIEVVFNVISSRDIIESTWFGKNTLEQCMEFASHLYKILVCGSKLIKENVVLMEPLLQIIMSTLKISQKGKTCRSHFTLSFEGLFEISQAFNAFITSKYCLDAKYWLEATLNTVPPTDIFHTNQEKLSGFLTWAVSTALKFDGDNMFNCNGSYVDLILLSKEASPEDSLISKLLRWLVASVIRGKLPTKSKDVNTEFSEQSSPQTLQSFLEYVEKDCGEKQKYEFDCEEMLASTIFYLQHLIGSSSSTVLSSVLSAVLILLLHGPSKYSDFMHGYGTDVASRCLGVRWPTEANPEWQWSFEKPWRDPKLEMTDLELIDEYHACQALLVMVSNFLGEKPFDSQVMSHLNFVDSQVFKWERRIVEINDN